MNKTPVKGKLLFFSIFSFFILASCVSKKDIIYFQNDEIDQSKVSNNYTTIFKPDDLLQITVSAEELKAVIPFNLPAVTYSVNTSSVAGQPTLQAYLIDSKGEIDFPVLGKIKIGGMSREEAIDFFKGALDPKFVKNPTINIRITNFKISILGDVQSPGMYTIPNERITILEALALAGDLNISGKRDQIKVMREIDSQKKEFFIDMKSNSLYTSPIYYLQQNDIIYVEPNYARIQSASSNSNTSLFISITGLLLTIVSILIR